VDLRTDQEAPTPHEKILTKIKKTTGLWATKTASKITDT
jgi:hypothetical protein